MILSIEPAERLQITTQVVFVFRVTMSVCIVLSVSPSTPTCIIRLISLDFRSLLQLCCSEPTLQTKEQLACKKERKKKKIKNSAYITLLSANPILLAVFAKAKLQHTVDTEPAWLTLRP